MKVVNKYPPFGGFFIIVAEYEHSTIFHIYILILQGILIIWEPSGNIWELFGKTLNKFIMTRDIRLFDNLIVHTGNFVG